MTEDRNAVIPVSGFIRSEGPAKLGRTTQAGRALHRNEATQNSLRRFLAREVHIIRVVLAPSVRKFGFRHVRPDSQGWRARNAAGLWRARSSRSTRGGGIRKGSDRSRTASTTLKIAVFAPMPSASATTAIRVKPGLCSRVAGRRQLWRNSWTSERTYGGPGESLYPDKQKHVPERMRSSIGQRFCITAMSSRITRRRPAREAAGE